MAHKNNYVLDGQIAPSATELTSLLPQEWKWSWYRREVKKHGWRGWQKCDATSNRGKRIGSHVHAMVEALLKGESYTAYLDKDRGILESPKRTSHMWEMAHTVLAELDHGPDMLVEQHLVNHALGIHGTADYITDSIDDLKTSNKISPEYAVQLAIYAACWNEANPADPKTTGRIIRVDKVAKKPYIQKKLYENLSQYLPVVKALRIIWSFINNKPLPDFFKQDVA